MNTSSKEARYSGLLPHILEATRQIKPETADRMSGTPVRQAAAEYETPKLVESGPFTVIKMVFITPVMATISISE